MGWDWKEVIANDANRKRIAADLVKCAEEFDGIEFDLEWMDGTQTNLALLADEVLKLLPKGKTLMISHHQYGAYQYPKNKISTVDGFTFQQYGPQAGWYSYNSFVNGYNAFRNYGWSDGIDLGLTVATVGMVVGVVLGMVLVNWAHSKGHVKEIRSFDDRPLNERLGVHLPGKRPDAGRQTVFSDSVDSLAWHVAVVGLSVGIGYIILLGLRALEIAIYPTASHRLFQAFPLFPLCMIGGVLLQAVVRACGHTLLVDHGQMQRISGAALDYLVLSAVATIKLSVVAANWMPLLALCVAGTLLSVLMVIFLAPRLFHEAWFERAIAEFGQSTGVTATGLLLLRTVDPENHTVAASSFGYKQLLHEAFMGGGLWTAFALTLVYTIGWFYVWLISLAMTLLWSLAAFFVIHRQR